MKVAKADEGVGFVVGLIMGAIVTALFVSGSMMAHYRERAVTNNAASYDSKTGEFVWADAVPERRGKE